MSTSDSKVMLTTVKQWPEWSRQFQSRAMTADLWAKINPAEDPKGFLEEPTLPDPANFAVTGSQETSTQTSTLSSQPANTGLTFQQALTLYSETNKRYERERKNVAALKEWVIQSVGPSYSRGCLQPVQNLRQWYANLLKATQAGNVNLRTSFNERYEELSTPMKKAPKDWNEWLFAWEYQLDYGLEIDVPFAKEASFWANHVLKAIEPVIPNFVQTYRILKSKEIVKNDLEIRDLTADIRQYLQNQSKTVGKAAKGSFGPTYGQTEGETSGDAPGDGSTMTRKGQKRKTSSEESERCLVCGIPGHDVDNCFHVFPEKAFFRWRPGNRAKMASDNLKKPEVAKRVEEAKRKAKKTPKRQKTETLKEEPSKQDD